MKLADLVRPERVVVDLKSQGKTEVLDELATVLANGQNAISARDFHRVLVERERLRSTGVGSGVAIPHGKVIGLQTLMLAVGVSRQGIDFESADERPVHIFMALAAPVNSTGEHLKALARIARLCSDAEFRGRLLECESSSEAYRMIVDEDERFEH